MVGLGQPGGPGLEKRKQSTRVWTDLVQFLVLEFHINRLSWSDDDSSVTIMDTPIRLPPSDDRDNDLMDVIQAEIMAAMTGKLEYIKAPLLEFLLQIIMQEKPDSA